MAIHLVAYDISIGYFPKPGDYAILETPGMLVIITKGGARGDSYNIPWVSKKHSGLPVGNNGL